MSINGIFIYERENKIMGNNKKSKKQRNKSIQENDKITQQFNETSQSQEDGDKESLKENVSSNPNDVPQGFIEKYRSVIFAISTAVAASIIVAVLGGFINSLLLPLTMDNKLQDLRKEISDDFTSLKIRVSTIENKLGITPFVSLKYSDEFINQISLTCESIENTVPIVTALNKNSEIIAEDISNNIEYTNGELSNQFLFIPYIENNKEILFYGKFNENGFWDGVCTFNIYKDNTLDIILEANYKDGKLNSYRKINQEILQSTNTDVWRVSNRIYEGDYNSGDTWTYFRTNEYQQKFSFNEAKIEDLIYFDDFETDLKSLSQVEGYYFGNTSNGLYNDDGTKNDSLPYLIKYTKEGFIRTLYVGSFVDGHFQGTGWEIAFDNYKNVNKYIYYNGTFNKKGNRVKEVDENDYIDQEQINTYIAESKIDFNCKLIWYDSEKY